MRRNHNQKCVAASRNGIWPSRLVIAESGSSLLIWADEAEAARRCFEDSGDDKRYDGEATPSSMQGGTPEPMKAICSVSYL